MRRTGGPILPLKIGSRLRVQHQHNNTSIKPRFLVSCISTPSVHGHRVCIARWRGVAIENFVDESVGEKITRLRQARLRRTVQANIPGELRGVPSKPVGARFTIGQAMEKLRPTIGN